MAGMAGSSRNVRIWAVVVVLAVAATVLGSVALMAPLFRAATETTPVAASRAAEPDEARAALGRAAEALRAGDRAAYLAALPASGKGPRRTVRELYDQLAGLPWTSFSFDITAIPSREGYYDVRAIGRLGRTGPSDRLAADRVLRLRVVDGHVVVTGDDTPEGVRGEYLMSFHDPIAVTGDGLLVVADRRRRQEAATVAAAGAEARSRLELLGIDSGDSAFVAVYATRGQMWDSLGDSDEERISFFSNEAPRLSARPWRTRDISILGPRLEEVGSWTPRMLAHELTHCYTCRWFYDTQHAPTFLLEGLATAVEGGRDFAPLREEVATGNALWPLADAIAAGDLWAGNSDEEIELAYLEAGSVVLYVLDRWGLHRLKPWMTAVADSDLDEAGLDEATRRTLGVGWDRFYEGWQKYVLDLP